VRGSNISRSAVGRYAKRYRPMVEDVIQIRSVTRALREHLPEGDSSLLDIAIHKATMQALRTLGEIEDRDDPASAKEVGEAARSIRTLGGSMREKAAYDAMIADKARREASDNAAVAARDAGVSDEAIDLIRRRILGLKS